MQNSSPLVMRIISIGDLSLPSTGKTLGSQLLTTVILIHRGAITSSLIQNSLTARGNRPARVLYISDSAACCAYRWYSCNSKYRWLPAGEQPLLDGRHPRRRIRVEAQLLMHVARHEIRAGPPRSISRRASAAAWPRGAVTALPSTRRSFRESAGSQLQSMPSKREDALAQCPQPFHLLPDRLRWFEGARPPAAQSQYLQGIAIPMSLPSNPLHVAPIGGPAGPSPHP